MKDLSVASRYARALELLTGKQVPGGGAALIERLEQAVRHERRAKAGPACDGHAA